MKRSLLRILFLSALIIASCSKSKAPGPTNTHPLKLQIVSGNNQTAKVGSYPADSIKVKATGDGFDYSKYAVEYKGSGCNADMPIIYNISANGTTAVGVYRLAGNVGAQTLQATLIEKGTKKRIDSVVFNFTGNTPTTGVNYSACTPPGRAYYFTKTGTGRLFAIFEDGGYNNLKYSDDDGISWNTVKGINASNPFSRITSDGKNQVIAYDGFDLYYSNDNGLTWKLQKLTFHEILELTYTPSGKLFVVSNSHDLYYSADNGANWSTLTFSDTNGGHLQLTSIREGVAGELYITGIKRGVFKSIDNGVTWKKLPNVTGGDNWDGNDGLFVDPGSGWLYKTAAIPPTIYLSKDGGNKYTLLTTTGVAADAFVKNNSVLYFEGGGGIYKIDGANNVVKIISTWQDQGFDGDFIVSNSGNILFNGKASLALQYVKP